jgi:hypothetical protein
MFNFVINSSEIIKIKHTHAMAKPIKETPVLKGKDARVFMANILSPTKRDTISDLTRQRMRENFEKINAVAKL